MPFRSVLLFAITLTVLLFSLVGSRAAAQAPLRFDDGFTTYDLIDYESRVDGVPTWEGYQISANLRVWGSAGRHSIFHVVFLDGTTQVGEVRCQASTQAGTPDYHYETRCTDASQRLRVVGDLTVRISMIDGATDVESTLATHTLRLLGEMGTKMPYAHGDTLFSLLRETLQAAHQVIDPQTGRPICLGQVSYGNFVFSRTGRMWVVGLGFNFPVLRENGMVDGLAAAFQAPEVLAGEVATPIADYVAILIAARSLTSFCDISEITKRVLSAAVSPRNVELYETVRFFESRSFGCRPPGARPSPAPSRSTTSRAR